VCYGLLALSHIFIQIYIGHLEHRRQHRQPPAPPNDKKRRSKRVSVIVPVYNEDPAILKACLDSIYNQAYGDLEIIIVDDGSKNRDVLNKRVYRHLGGGRYRVILPDKQQGKRHAQRLGFDCATGDYIVTVDSDTILRSPDAITNILKRFKRPEVAAVTGDVRVENKDVNLLTRLIAYRYWTAFHQERAAQSFFYVLMCCSGPFSAYRRDVIEDVKERYTSQMFLGALCTFGDDRHLTNLVLEEGHMVTFDNRAIAYTYVPEHVAGYLKQQVRWNKSFYREMLWTLKAFRKHHWYLMYDLIMQFILPFLLLFALGATAYQALVTHHLSILLQYGLSIAGIGLIRAFYGIYRTHDTGFLLFVVYGFMHVCLLLPTRLYALCTMRETGWGTR
jgi:hyaluronan synthase/N-acetylglucosaminyltransferase